MIERLKPAYHRLLMVAAQRIVTKESRAVKKAAKQHLEKRAVSDFQRWLSDFYLTMPDHVKRTLGPVQDAYMTTVYQQAAAATGTLIKEIPVEVKTWLTGYMDTYIKRHLGSSQGQINKILNAQDIDNVYAALVQRMDDWEQNRAKKIADDEVVRQANAIAREAYRKAGVTKYKWVAVGDNCPFCRELNGKIVGRDEPFMADGDVLYAKDQNDNYMALKASGPKLHPPIHRGCDCYIMPVKD
jgi:SPP1 gp7 family putative phage head morphogenesis protein